MLWKWFSITPSNKVHLKLTPFSKGLDESAFSGGKIFHPEISSLFCGFH